MLRHGAEKCVSFLPAVIGQSPTIVENASGFVGALVHTDWAVRKAGAEGLRALGQMLGQDLVELGDGTADTADRPFARAVSALWTARGDKMKPVRDASNEALAVYAALQVAIILRLELAQCLHSDNVNSRMRRINAPWT